MELITAGLLVATIYFVINFLKFIASGSWNAVITNVVGVIGAWVVLMLAAQSSVFAGWQVPVEGVDALVGDLNWSDMILVAIAFTASASLANGVLGAIDSNRDTNKPPLTKL